MNTASQNGVPASHYIHGSSEEEQTRLSLLNTFLNEACLREMRLQPYERILDVGSGLGQFTRLMARQVNQPVIGVERDENQLRRARVLAQADGESELCDFRQGSAFQLPLAPFEWGSFDLVHTRFLLEHVPQPLAVVKQLYQAVRPGGRLVLMDDDHEVLRLYPEPPGVVDLWKAYMRSYERLGNDPYVGRRLVSLLHEAGAQPVRNTYLFFGSCAGDATFPAVTTNFIEVVAGARTAILAHQLFEPAYFDEVLTTLRKWAQRPDAALWYPLCYAEGVK